MVVFYFKNETLLRTEIRDSEDRTRIRIDGTEERLRAKIDGVRDQVHGVETRLAVLEDRHERGRSPSAAALAAG